MAWALFGSSADFAPHSILTAGRIYPPCCRQHAWIPEQQTLLTGIVKIEFYLWWLADLCAFQRIPEICRELFHKSAADIALTGLLDRIELGLTLFSAHCLQCLNACRLTNILSKYCNIDVLGEARNEAKGF